MVGPATQVKQFTNPNAINYFNVDGQLYINANTFVQYKTLSKLIEINSICYNSDDAAGIAYSNEISRLSNNQAQSTQSVGDVLFIGMTHDLSGMVSNRIEIFKKYNCILEKLIS